MPDDHQGGDEHRCASAETHQTVDHLDNFLLPTHFVLTHQIDDNDDDDNNLI